MGCKRLLWYVFVVVYDMSGLTYYYENQMVEKFFYSKVVDNIKQVLSCLCDCVCYSILILIITMKWANLRVKTFSLFKMAEDLDVEAMLEAPYNKSVSIIVFQNIVFVLS